MSKGLKKENFTEVSYLLNFEILDVGFHRGNEFYSINFKLRKLFICQDALVRRQRRELAVCESSCQEPT